MRCGQVHHQQPSVCVDRNVTLASDDLLVGVVTACACRRCLDGLTVDDRSRWARLAPDPFTVHHQGDVVDGAEQQQPHEAAEPPIHRLPRAEIGRQHPPATRAVRHAVDCIEDLSQIHRWFAPSLRRLGQQWLICSHSSSVRSDGYRFVLRAIPAIRPRLSRVHVELESRTHAPRQPFSNRL